MRWLTSLVLLLLLPLLLVAEPMKHPVTGEDGFWISREELQLTVVGLQERDLLKDANITLYLNLNLANGKLKGLQSSNKTLWVAVGIEGVIIGGLVVWTLLSP